jgi:phosphatidylserine decarboxylase
MIPTTLLYCESPLLGTITTVLPITLYYFKYFKLAIAAIILLIFMISFYRYYPYNKRYTSDIIISPAEGTITNLKYFRDHYYISIFLSPLNVHTQIYPVNGTVIKRTYDQTGKFGLATDIDKCRDNEKKIHYILMCNNSILKLTQIAGFLPRRITSSDQVPKKVQAGEYLGMIKFGSRVDILFPANKGFILNVREGQSINIGDKLGEYL